MNLPNKLTILRIIMIPFFVLFMLLDGGVSQTYRYIAAVIFIVASFTDLLDGKIARPTLENSWTRWQTSFWSVPA